MFFCLLRLGSRLGPQPVSGQSAMEPSESVTAAGQSIATFVPAALVPAFLLAFLVVCAWAQLIAPKAKTARRSVIRYRFMERFPSKVEIGDELRDRPKGFM